MVLDWVRWTPLYAVSPGTVDVLDVDALDSTGLMVSYKGPDGWWVRVFHTSPKGIRLPKGSHVEVGSIIGFVGTTGFSTGNHAHIQIHRPDGRTIDPLSQECIDWVNHWEPPLAEPPPCVLPLGVRVPLKLAGWKYEDAGECRFIVSKVR